MLEVANLEVVYNDVVLVLRGISINVPDRAIVALLGANGAGKTTTLRAIGGLLDVHDGDVTKGFIRWQGEEIHEKLPSQIVRSGIAQVLEGRRIFAELSVDDNLRAGGYTNRSKASVGKAYDRVMTLFPPLAERRKSTAGYLSGGEQQMLAIGRALMADPALAVARTGSETRAADQGDHRRDQRAGHLGALDRAERQHGAVHSASRLHHGDRQDRDGR
jgi:branched-chain amino acid transport system ATP-binding protein